MIDKGLAKHAERAQAFVGDGETVRFATVVFGRHPILLAGGILGALLGKPRLLVITDASVKLVKDSGKVKANLTEELASAPIDADLGTLTGLNAKYVFPNGEQAYISKIFFGKVREARGMS